MSLVSPDDVEGLMATGLEAAVLQGIIDREEDWLAFAPQYGIGQLAGERTQRVYRDRRSSAPIWLARPTDAVTVVDGTDDPASVTLIGRLRVEPTIGIWTGPTVDLTYTPTDVLQVEAAVLELVRLRVTASPYSQESSDGGHSYTRPSDVQSQRERIARSVAPYRGPVSVRQTSPELVSVHRGHFG